MKPALGMLSLVLLGGLEMANGAAVSQWHQETGFRWAELNVPTGGKTGFHLLPPEESGINFTNTLDLRAGEANRVLFNGSGVGVGDYNKDGLPDIVVGNKKGTFVLLHEKKSVSPGEWEKAQPRPVNKAPAL